MDCIANFMSIAYIFTDILTVTKTLKSFSIIENVLKRQM